MFLHAFRFIFVIIIGINLVHCSKIFGLDKYHIVDPEQPDTGDFVLEDTSSTPTTLTDSAATTSRVCSSYRWCWYNPMPQSSSLRAVWGVSSSDLWVVGLNGIIFHWNGLEWKKEESGTTSELRSIWGSASKDVWVVGEKGTLVHWNGTVWEKQSIV